MGKTYTFDMNVSIWLRDVEIYANSREEAEEKLNDMRIDDLLEDGIIKDFEITDLDCEEEIDEEE